MGPFMGAVLEAAVYASSSMRRRCVTVSTILPPPCGPRPLSATISLQTDDLNTHNP